MSRTKHNTTRLGVNIDHVATLRQARGENDPDPVEAAALCLAAGADGIVCHLREDRRHIQDEDVRALRELTRKLGKPLNLEMAVAKDVVAVALAVKPDVATIVPERRRELTTEGGLDVAGSPRTIKRAVKRLKQTGIEVSLFVDPDPRQITAARLSGADAVELHTGHYANSAGPAKEKALHALQTAAREAERMGLRVAAGHGLKYHDTAPVALIPEIEELNIGHAIIAYAVVHGLTKAVRHMKSRIRRPQLYLNTWTS